MKLFKIIIFTTFISIFGTSYIAFADIKLDGEFSDWTDKLTIHDSQGDSFNSDEDLKTMKYYNDGENLYLYFERYPDTNAISYWDLQVIFFNGTGYEQNHYTPWDNPKDNFQWNSTRATTIKVNVSSNGSSSDPSIVTTDFGQYYTASPNAREIEFMIPLKKIGLLEKEIKFAAKSDPSAYDPNIDWIPEHGPILVTDGPILGELTPIFIILSFIFVGISLNKFKLK